MLTMPLAMPCSVCTHPAHETIDSALTDRSQSVISLAQTHSLSRDLINYHRRAHVQPQPQPQPHIPPPSFPRGGQSRADLRQGKTTARARERFLKAYADCGNVSAAARSAGVGRATVYVWAEHDSEFALAFKQADLQATESLEKEAWRRARDGFAEEVWQHGKLVGTIQRYSDRLLEFMLRARRPDVYRDRVDVSVTPVIKTVAGIEPAEVL